jgi:hypothetical protein
MGPQPLPAALRVIVADVSVDGPDLATTFIKNDLGRSYGADKKESWYDNKFSVCRISPDAKPRFSGAFFWSNCGATLAATDQGDLF